MLMGLKKSRRFGGEITDTYIEWDGSQTMRVTRNVLERDEVRWTALGRMDEVQASGGSVRSARWKSTAVERTSI